MCLNSRRTLLKKICDKKILKRGEDKTLIEKPLNEMRVARDTIKVQKSQKKVNKRNE